MPELPPFQPNVNVFHFTSKVSSAKIAKYKLATERGMTNTPGSTGIGMMNAKTKQELPVQPENGPNKRPRLRLNVREPRLPDGDDILVGPPRRGSNRTSSQQNAIKRSWSGAKSKANDSRSPSGQDLMNDDSSELSSCDSNILEAVADDILPPAAEVSKSAGNEQYGDFYSYYIQDDAKDEQPVKKVNPSTKVAQKPKPIEQSKPTRPHNHQNAQQQRTLPRHSQAPTQQQHRPPPTIAPTNIDIRFHEPDTIPIMIRKLEALSAALEEFGGVPPIPSSPKPQEDDDTVVDFLAMFGGPREAEGASKASDNGPTSFAELLQPGIKDMPLVYGIQFIMNALRCWAEQRIAVQRRQQLEQAHYEAQRRASLGITNGALPPIPMPDLTPIDLFQTTEGRAIQAFRAVVECGCLQVNGIIPQKLAKALRRLYMQIDHLINQGADKGNAPWRCLSYSAQIEANRVRVNKWKEAQEKAQQEMIRQHQLAHQQMMRQMGLPDHLTQNMFYHQGQDEDAVELRTERDAFDLVRLPVNLEPEPAVSPHLSGHAGLSQQRSAAETITPVQHTGTTAFLPRSGQSMKFSFAPSNTAAVQLFGAQAFPAPGHLTVARHQPVISRTNSRETPIVLDVDEPPTQSPGFAAINKPRPIQHA